MKSTFFAERVVELCVAHPGFRVLCGREIQKSIAQSVKHLIQISIEKFNVGAYFDIKDQEIRTHGGGLITFQGMASHTADSIKSLEGYDVAYIEEAQSISQRTIDLLIPTIRKPGSELWWAYNPDTPEDPVDALFMGPYPPKRTIIVDVGWKDNPWFPEELRDEMEMDKLRDLDKYNWVWGGQYRGASEARVFRNYRTGDLDAFVPDNAVWFYGADWGFSVDPLAATRSCIFQHEGKEVLYVSDEIYEVGVPTERLPITLDGLPDARGWPIRVDSAEPQTIDYVRRHGFPKLVPAIKGQGSIKAGIKFLQGYDIVVSPRCPSTRKEFDNYAYKKDPHTGLVLPVLEKGNDHAIDSLRYATEYLHRKDTRQRAKKVERPSRPDDYGGGEIHDADAYRVV